MERRFTYRYYESIVLELLNNGYAIEDYKTENHASHKTCILRHDVDYSLRKAVEFAKFERALDSQLVSTYFLLISSDLYNISSLKNIKCIERILAMDLQIGLHFDETRYPQLNEMNFADYVNAEICMLEKIIGTKIKAVSMHRPSQHTLAQNYTFGNYINSYGEQYFKNYKYISDSRMNWREDAIDIIKSQAFNKLHILTHPFWYADEVQDLKSKMADFINAGNKEKYDMMNMNFSNLSEVMTREEISNA